MSRNRKQPKKSSGIKVSKKPRCATHFPEEPPTDGEILFRFRYFDDRFQPAERTGHDCFYDISGLLKSLAISGWNSVIQNRTHHHEISLDRLSREACKRLEQLAFDDLDSLFSMRLSAKKRLFGVRKEPYFYVLWWDPDHKVCPSKKKHT
ncbi:MAG: hypothetical protein AAGC44_02045 [Planctomycetota bacterium]